MKFKRINESIKTNDRMSKELFDELWSKVEMKLNKYSGVRGGIPIGLVDSIKDTMKRYVDDTETINVSESESNSNGWERGECHWKEMRQDLLEPLTNFIRRMKEGTVEFWSDHPENAGSKLGEFGMDDIIAFILKVLKANPNVKRPFLTVYFNIMRAFAADVGITCPVEDNISKTSFSSNGSYGLMAIPQKYGVDDSHMHTLYEMAMKRNGYDVDMPKDEFMLIYGDNQREVTESEETGNWFDEFGQLTRDLPQECIDACTHRGSCDDDVAFWVEELEFDKGLPIEMAKRWLRSTGGWTKEELDEETDKDIAEKVLWVICGNIKEEPDYIPCLEW